MTSSVTSQSLGEKIEGEAERDIYARYENSDGESASQMCSNVPAERHGDEEIL
jgi:hypothetical protein